MTQRLLIFSIKEEPWRGAWRETFDVDIEEPFINDDGELSYDLRGFLYYDSPDECWVAYLYQGDETGENCMERVHVFPPDTPMDEMTQWLWLKVAAFNEDTGRFDVGHIREGQHD